MPPVLDPANIYSQIKPSDLQAQFASWPHRVFVPNGANNTVSVLDADTKTVLSTFKTGRQPQHVVPSYDLTKVWVLDNQGNNAIPVDPITGTPGKPVPVDDPYNLYFTPDGKYAIVVAERYQRLDYYTPDLKTRQFSVTLPECEGVNHGDWSADGRYALFTCEFQGNIAKVDMMPSAGIGPEAMMADGEVQSMLKEKLAEFRTTLEGKEKDLAIFDERLVSDDPKTLQELGDKFKISRERVRQLEQRLLQRLRDYLKAEMGDATDVD
jgi:YVTN family beta-propeller protein